MPTRYYIHGDITEEGQVYCRRCDAFVDNAHFYEGPHSRPSEISDYERARMGLKAFSQREDPHRFVRPIDAENIFL